MKRLCVCFVLFALFCLPILSACAPCEHDWILQEGVEKVLQCSICGEYHLENKKPCTEHRWVLCNSENSGIVGVEKNYACANCLQTKAEKVKNVVLIVGDGMGLEHVAAGQLASGVDFRFTRWSSATVNTDCLDSATNAATKTTDSAAAATALACGQLTYKRYVGKDANGNDLQTIFDVAMQQGMKTGYVTTDKPYGATPSCFSAHSLDRGNTNEILSSQLQSGLNLMCAARSESFHSMQEQMTQNGYVYCNNYENRNNLQQSEKAVCLWDLEGYGESVKLCDATTFALDFLDNDNGFVLMIEQAHVDKNSHDNNFDGMVSAVNSLNDTVEAVLEWVGNRNDTAILITADHETGDLSVSANAMLPNSYETASGSTIYYKWTQASHSDTDVGLFCYGFDVNFARLPYFGSQRIVKNTDVFVIMKSIVDEIHRVAK